LYFFFDRYGLANEERAKAKYIAMLQDHHENFQVSPTTILMITVCAHILIYTIIYNKYCILPGCPIRVHHQPRTPLDWSLA